MMTCYETAEGIYDIGVYRRPNGTLVYLDLQYPLNTRCNASIKADPDLAGPGIMLSFVLPAAITIAIAVLRASIVFISEYGRGAVEQAAASLADIPPDTLRRRIWRQKNGLLSVCDTLLMSLCDLQVLTGGALVVAGFIQGPALSFYHEGIIVRYWWLVMDAFWCVPQRAASVSDVILPKIRKVLVVAAVFSAAAFQVREGLRQPCEWDYLDGQRCYLYDTAYGYDSHIQYTGRGYAPIGMLLYLFGITASLFKRSDEWLESSEQRIRHLTLDWWSTAESEARHLYSYFEKTGNVPAPSQPPSQSLSGPQAVKSIASVLFYGTVGAVLFSAHQYLAYWSYADGYEPINILWHSYNVLVETIALYELKELNGGLKDGDEASWGFAQCLPTILLFAMLLSLCIVVREKHLKTQ